MIFILPLLSPREDLKQFVREAVALSVWKVEKKDSEHPTLLAFACCRRWRPFAKLCLSALPRHSKSDVRARSVEVSQLVCSLHPGEWLRSLAGGHCEFETGRADASVRSQQTQVTTGRNWSSQRNMRQLSEIFAFVIPQTSRLSSIG